MTLFSTATLPVYIRVEIDERESLLFRRVLWTRATFFNERYRHHDFRGETYHRNRRGEVRFLDLRGLFYMHGAIVTDLATIRDVERAMAWCLDEHATGRYIQDQLHGLARVRLTDDEVTTIEDMQIALKDYADDVERRVEELADSA